MPTGNVVAARVDHKYQKGTLTYKNGAWHARYYAEVPGRGEVTYWRQRSSVLGRIEEFPNEKDIMPVFAGFMATINERYLGQGPDDPMLVRYVEQTYFTSKHFTDLAGSTKKEYKAMWDRYLGDADLLKYETMGSVRTSTVNRLLEAVAGQHDISKTTLAHIKAFLSGVYKFARNQGDFDEANPVRDAMLPKARGKSETADYDLETIVEMLEVLEPREQAIVGIAGFAGLSRSEIRGTQWQDWEDSSLYVRRAVWESEEKETKNAYRKAPVPLIPQLEQILDAYWQSAGNPETGWMFPASRGKMPMELNNILNRHVKDRLKRAGIKWSGWHAFRRGLASNLSELDVPDNVIQQILRHGDLGTTQRFYRKTRRPAVTKAMKKLSGRLSRLSEAEKDRSEAGSRANKGQQGTAVNRQLVSE